MLCSGHAWQDAFFPLLHLSPFVPTNSTGGGHRRPTRAHRFLVCLPHTRAPRTCLPSPHTPPSSELSSWECSTNAPPHTDKGHDDDEFATGEEEGFVLGACGVSSPSGQRTQSTRLPPFLPFGASSPCVLRQPTQSSRLPPFPHLAASTPLHTGRYTFCIVPAYTQQCRPSTQSKTRPVLACTVGEAQDDPLSVLNVPESHRPRPAGHGGGSRGAVCKSLAPLRAGLELLHGRNEV